MSKTHMTIEELAKLLEIEHNKISQDTQDTNLFHIKNVTLKNINKGLWTKDINIKFIACKFQEDIILPEQTELYIQPQLTFMHCNFLKNWIAVGAIITKDFLCISCGFKGLIDCSKATFKGRVNFFKVNFSNEVRFIRSKFDAEIKNGDNNIIENNFIESSFGGNVFFDGAEFKGRVIFFQTNFSNEARFIGTKFNAEIKNGDNNIIENNFIESSFGGNVSFSKATFKGRVDFGAARFESYTLFNSLTFEKKIYFNLASFKKEVRFSSVTFNEVIFERVFFNETFFISPTFNKEIDFSQSIFSGITSFENIAPQDSKPNFLYCTFGNQFNIEQKHLKYDFNEIKRLSQKPNDSTESQQKSKINKAPSYRDLFRRLKSNRLAHHNLIDASEIHTQELYAREIELKNKQDKTLKDQIDRWQLLFYRITSDHHTDLAMIFNNTIMLIALFGVFVFGLDYLKQLHLDFSSQYQGKINHSSIAIDSFIILDSLEKSYSLTQNPPKNIESKQSFIEKILNQIYSLETWFIFGICCLFLILFFLGLIYSNKYKLNSLRNIVSYFVVLIMLIVKPALLLPFVGKFFDESLKVDFPAMQSLSILYCILMFLMLFSLQKTARKNSVVPN